MLDNQDIKQWVGHRITQEIFFRMLKYFDPHRAILAGFTSDRLKGRAEVLDFIINQENFFKLADPKNGD